MGLHEQIPRYKSHKIVRAAKILGVSGGSSGFPGGELHLEIPGRSDPLVLPVDRDYMEKHNPRVGGYYMLYKDGYESWSPADALEGGYTPIDGGESGENRHEGMAAAVEKIRNATHGSLEIYIDMHSDGTWTVRGRQVPLVRQRPFDGWRQSPGGDPLIGSGVVTFDDRQVTSET